MVLWVFTSCSFGFRPLVSGLCKTAAPTHTLPGFGLLSEDPWQELPKPSRCVLAVLHKAQGAANTTRTTEQQQGCMIRSQSSARRSPPHSVRQAPPSIGLWPGTDHGTVETFAGAAILDADRGNVLHRCLRPLFTSRLKFRRCLGTTTRFQQRLRLRRLVTNRFRQRDGGAGDGSAGSDRIQGPSVVAALVGLVLAPQ